MNPVGIALSLPVGTSVCSTRVVVRCLAVGDPFNFGNCFEWNVMGQSHEVVLEQAAQSSIGCLVEYLNSGHFWLTTVGQVA